MSRATARARPARRTGPKLRRSLVSVALIGAVLASTAAAATRIGTNRAERLNGTPRADYIDPRGGRDTVRAGSGADRIKAFDGARDAIACGPGVDVVAGDLGDAIARDCETVSRRLALDRISDPAFTHSTHVEPDSFSFGSTLVTTYQVGRAPAPGGAAAAIGFSTTRNGGRTWRSWLLPRLTVNNRPAGPWPRASDPVIGYDAAHGVWLASSLVVGPTESGLSFHRSRDGVSWGGPVYATRVRDEDLAVDKQWFACDNWRASPFFGRCYLAYTDVLRNRISLQTSADGGVTWSAPIGSPDNAGSRNVRTSPGVQPVVRPNGELLVVFLEDNRMAVIRSTDGGQTLTRTQAIAPVVNSGAPRFRAFSLPTADVGADGTVYVSWMDCAFRGGEGCDGSDIVLVRSSDGATWNAPQRVPMGSTAEGVYYTLPGLAADPARAGRLSLPYYRLLPGGAIDAFYTGSVDHGRTWSAPRRFSPQSLARAWMPVTQYGPMIGDYISSSFVGGRPIAIIVLANPPRRGRLEQSVFAAQP